MKSWFLFFSVWAASAWAVAPQLAVTVDDVCLLGDNGKLSCWEDDSMPSNAFGDTATEAIAGGEEVFCAIQQGQVHCEMADKRRSYRACRGTDSLGSPASNLNWRLAALNKVRLLAGGYDENFCAWDEKAGLTCANAWSDDILPPIPLPEKPLEIGVSSGAVCAILADHQVKCWGPFPQLQISERSFGSGDPVEYEGGDPYDRVLPEFCRNYYLDYRAQKLPQKLFQVPEGLKDPRSLLVDTRGQACVIDQNTLKCWGDYGPHSFVPSFADVKDLIYPEQFGSSVWLDGGEVHRLGAHEETWKGKLPGAALLAQRYTNICAADEKVVLCNDDRKLEHGLPVHYRAVGELVAILRQAKDLCYRDRQAVYDTAIQRMRELPPAGQAFVFALIAPLVQGTASAIFDAKIKNRFASALAYWAPRAGASADEIVSALRLIVPLLPEPENTAWAEVKVAAGQALAEGGGKGSLRKVLSAFEGAESELAHYEASAHFRPSIESLRGIVAKFRASI